MEAGARRCVSLPAVLSILLCSHRYGSAAYCYGLLHHAPLHPWHLVCRKRRCLLHCCHCFRSLFFCLWLHIWITLRSEQGQRLDQDNASSCSGLLGFLRRDCFVAQCSRDCLFLTGCYSFRHHGCGASHMGFHLLPPDPLWNHRGEESYQALLGTLQSHTDSASDSRQTMVHECLDRGAPRGAASFRQHLHRNVLYLHLLLEL
mmetsp:Transcript_37333/g.72902  ORF Transcript_37333/g.72902 Transcript_37333/m.72902 type:complete len:203 (+) Transcript_37333:753-1361(+)